MPSPNYGSFRSRSTSATECYSGNNWLDTPDYPANDDGEPRHTEAQATMSTTEVTNVNPNLRSLAEAGTSPWLDLLGRSLVASGELARLIAEDSLKGVTSNPSIFEKSILESEDYDEQLSALAGEG